MNPFVLAVVFRRQISKSDNFKQNCWFFENCRRNTTVSKKTFTEFNYDVVLHYSSLPIYPLYLPKFCPIQKQLEILKNCQYLAKTTLGVCLIFYKLIFFETLIVFLESTIKLITRIFDFQKQ